MSDDHHRVHDFAVVELRGTFLTLDQGAYVTPIVQGGIFGFPRRP
jgi:hypothetical protein